MKRTKSELALFDLLKISLWNKYPELDYSSFSDSAWNDVYRLAIQQGVCGLVFDGVVRLNIEVQPNEKFMLVWAANIKLLEKRYEQNTQILLLLNNELRDKGIKMLLLKGKSLAMFYPQPAHREYGDIDIYLFDKFNAGNNLLQEKGELIKTSAKHITFKYHGFPIENHKTFIDLVKENDILSRNRRRSFEDIECELKKILVEEEMCFLDENNEQVPSPTFYFLFLLMHSGTHLGEELAVRHLCDWACFLMANRAQYDEQRILRALNHLSFRKLCFLLTDAAIYCLGMPVDFAPSFYRTGGREQIKKRFIDSLFHHFPGANEVNRNTWLCKWRRFYSKQWKYNLFYKEYLPERLMRGISVWLTGAKNSIY